MGADKGVSRMNDISLAELSGALIQVFEGLKLQAYRDTGGVWTIGYGRTGLVHGQKIAHDTVITQAEAEAFLAEDQAALFKAVEGRPLLEAAALVSFGYNCGAGALASVLGGHATLLNFTHDAHKQELAGLVARRRLEETLILVSQQQARASAQT